MKKALLISICLVAGLSVWARETRESSVLVWDSLRHEVRLGYGDPLFESATKYEITHIGKPNTEVLYLTGHLFAEYQYSWLWWLSTGMQVDFNSMGWRDLRDPAPTHNYYNLSFLPTIRFSYYRHPWVTLYSSAFVGLTINGGTETDPVRHKKTICYPGFGITALGVQVGHKGFFGTVEIGGLCGLQNKNDIVMLMSRIFSISIGYRFNK